MIDGEHRVRTQRCLLALATRDIDLQARRPQPRLLGDRSHNGSLKADAVAGVEKRPHAVLAVRTLGLQRARARESDEHPGERTSMARH